MMDRLTTDFPETNYETLMNFAYHSDRGQTFLRYAEEPIVLLTEFMRQQCQKRGCDCDKIHAETLDGFMGCNDCPLGILYYCAVQAAELRERLAAYENTGLTPEEIIAMKERLVVDPSGTDKIDELEEAIDFVRSECENLKMENKRLREFIDKTEGNEDE